MEIGSGIGERFTILDRLGEGAMGEVFLAHDKYNDRQVALKVARLAAEGDDAVDAKTEKLWFNEMRLAGRLNHPYIVGIYEASTVADRGFLIMEYVPGGTLKAFTAPGTLLEMHQVADIIFKICHALDYANTQGLLHRDIKPANILLTDDGTPKISDFGSCYLLDNESTQVLEVGTLAYMPPEQFTGAEPNVQTDIYSVGVMAYQLLTGAFPFAAASQAAMIYQKTYDEPFTLESRRADIPAALRFAVHRAIHKDPALRYSRWAEFREDLSLAFPEMAKVELQTSESARFARYNELAFFRGFSETELWEAVRLGLPRSYPAGKPIFLQGEADTTVYVLQDGELDVSVAGVKISRIAEGEGFGELAFIEGLDHRRTATVSTQRDSTVIAFEDAGLKMASGRLQAAFGKAFVRSLATRLVLADQRYVLAVGKTERITSVAQ